MHDMILAFRKLRERKVRQKKKEAIYELSGCVGAFIMIQKPLIFHSINSYFEREMSNTAMYVTR